MTSGTTERVRKSPAGKSPALAILSILKEERRRRIHEYGFDRLDTERLYKFAVERLVSGRIGICECCGGIIGMKRSLLSEGPFVFTCSNKCSYELVMRAICDKINEIKADLANKKALANQDLKSNERAKGDHADSFTSQDINLKILQGQEKLLKKLQERLAFIEKHPEDFNICATCEEEIPLDRLTTAPETGLCRTCKPNSKDTRTNGRSSRRVICGN